MSRTKSKQREKYESDYKGWKDRKIDAKEAKQPFKEKAPVWKGLKGAVNGGKLSGLEKAIEAIVLRIVKAELEKMEFGVKK